MDVSLQTHNAHLEILVQVSGVNLCRITEITKNVVLKIDVQGRQNTETLYIISLSNNEPDNTYNNMHLPSLKPAVPTYYAEIKKRLQAHYNTADKVVQLTKVHSPADAAFLQKTNDIIFLNIGNESFDAGLLSQQMFLSRTQLFRKLKNITGMAPAGYIKHLRLQKAKTMLETTDIRVGEVAFETGFESTSHFTKVFTKRYGFNPSLLKRKQMQQTDKTM
jgi:AraC-like DNA-binding protein